MDEVLTQSSNPVQPASPPAQGNGVSMLKKKWVLILIGLLVIGIVGFVILLATAKKPAQQISQVAPTEEPIPTPLPTLTVAPDVQKALNEAIAKQTKVDQEFADWQVSVRKDNPMKGLPLATDKYFVYFDIEKDVFIGRLYPKTGDNVEQMKSLIVQQLKTVNQLPVDNYKFEWQINP